MRLQNIVDAVLSLRNTEEPIGIFPHLGADGDALGSGCLLYTSKSAATKPAPAVKDTKASKDVKQAQAAQDKKAAKEAVASAPPQKEKDVYKRQGPRS